MTDEDCWTVKEAAQFLRAEVKTVRGWAASGKIPAFKPGKEWLFDPQVLREWAAGEARKNTRPKPAE